MEVKDAVGISNGQFNDGLLVENCNNVYVSHTRIQNINTLFSQTAALRFRSVTNSKVDRCIISGHTATNSKNVATDTMHTNSLNVIGSSSNIQLTNNRIYDIQGTGIGAGGKT